VWQQAVASLFANANGTGILNLRSPAGVPQATIDVVGGSDVPFKSLAAGYVTGAQSDPQYPGGVDINSTLLRALATTANGGNNLGPIPANNSGPSATRQVQVTNFNKTANNPLNTNWATGIVGTQHPYRDFEGLNKIYNNLTTRSNVFAVFLTVGFFAVQDTNPATGQPIVPPIIGQEIGRAQGKNIRHRMFAVVDRTSMVTPPLTVTAGAPFGVVAAGNNQTVGIIANSGGPGLCYGTTSLNDTANGTYNISMNWSVQPGSTLVIDQGNANQETITVTGVSATGNANIWNITANFANAHGASATISLPGIPGPVVANATFTVAGQSITANVPTVFGNPGPQPAYTPGAGPQPAFSARGNNAVVPYFNVIQ